MKKIWNIILYIIIIVQCIVLVECVNGKRYSPNDTAICADTAELSNASVKFPENWIEEILSADKASSWFYQYYEEEDTIDNMEEMRRIFKTLFENDSVLKMRICGWTDLDTILHAYDISFYSGNITRSVPSYTLSNG